MDINLPTGATQVDLQDFLNSFKPKPRHPHNCSNCYFGPNCRLGSCECSTAVFNRENPPRWLDPKKVVAPYVTSWDEYGPKY